MRCSVKNCTNWNGNAASSRSFFRFPSDKELVKKWINFCRRGKSFNARTAFICMDHFTADDVENNLQFEMGLANKRLLKRGAIPSIFKEPAENNMLAAKRAERIQRRDNKKIVKLLLQEENNKNDSSKINEPLEEPTDPLSTESVEVETPPEKTNKNSRHLVKEIDSLRKEIEALRRENSCLQDTQKKHISEITALKQSLCEAERDPAFDLEIVEKRLSYVEYETKSMEEKLHTKFIKGQITKLKTGIKRPTWTEDNRKLNKDIENNSYKRKRKLCDTVTSSDFL